MLVHEMRINICEECRYALLMEGSRKMHSNGEEMTNDVTIKKRVNANKKVVFIADYLITHKDAG